ncbi:MAG: hypothetical protein FD163_403 [Hyphomonadaceae bacterium]|nr:MAG: hypothetical protein FD163_403 [Hyphomonadaceae bacterium]
MSEVLMPKATAVWLIDNTALTFVQIAEFCGLHHLEVKGIADGDVAGGVRGQDPIGSGQLSRDEIAKAEKDPDYRLKKLEGRTLDLPVSKRRTSRYTPLSRRQDRPNAIAWFLRYHPEITLSQISKLIGTTKSTIESVRDRTHWDSNNIKPVDPVAVGLCGQIELDRIVSVAAAKKAKEAAKSEAATAVVEE